MVINDYNGFIHGYLVGGLEPRNFEWLSHHIGNVIIPTDERIFFRGVETTNQICSKQRIKSFSRNDSDNHAENGEHVDMFSQDMIRNIGYTNMNGIMIELNINTC